MSETLSKGHNEVAPESKEQKDFSTSNTHQASPETLPVANTVKKLTAKRFSENNQDLTVSEKQVDLRAFKEEVINQSSKNLNIKPLPVFSQKEPASEGLSLGKISIETKDPIEAKDPFNEVSSTSSSKKLVYWAASLVTLGWLYFAGQEISFDIVNLEASSLGGLMGGLLTPVFLLWFTVLAGMRYYDGHQTQREIRAEIAKLLQPVEGADEDVRRSLSTLYQEASVVDETTNRVLSSIAKAREGLRSEMNDFSTMSNNAERTVNHLTSVMKDRMVKLDNLTKALFSRTSKIGDKAQQSSQELEKAAAILMEKVAKVEEGMDAGVSKVLNASSSAQGKIDAIKRVLGQVVDGLHETSQEVSLKLEESINSFNGQDENLKKMVELIIAEKNNLKHEITQQIQSIQETMNHATSDLSLSRHGLHEEKEALETVLTQLSEQSDLTGDSIVQKVDELSGVIMMMRDASDETDVKLSNQVESLSNLLEKLGGEGDRFTEIGQSTARKLGEATTSAIAGADMIGSAVRKGAEDLNKASDEAFAQSRQIELTISDRIGILQKLNQKVSDRLEDMTGHFDQSKADFDQISAEARRYSTEMKETLEQQTHDISNTYKDMLSKLTVVKDSFQEPIHEMELTVGQLEEKSRQVDETLSSRVKEIALMSENLVEQASAVRESLRGQVNELSSLSGQITGQSKIVNQQLLEQKQELSVEVLNALSDIQKVSNSLAEQAHLVTSSSNKASERIHALDGKIAARYEEINVGSGQAFDMLDQLSSRLSKESSEVKDVISTVQSNVNQAIQTLKSGIEDISEQSGMATQRTGHLIDAIEGLSGSIQSVTEIGMQSVKDVTESFDHSTSEMKTVTADIAATLREASSHLREQVDTIGQAANQASLKVKEVGKTLENQASDVHLITDKAALRVETVQKAITDKFHEIGGSIGEAVTQLEEVGLRFQKCSDEVSRATDQIEARFAGASGEARNEIRMLSEVAENTAALASKTVSRLKEEARGLVTESEKTLRALDVMGENYADRGTEMNVQMEKSIHLTQEYSTRIRNQIKSVAEVANLTADQIVLSLSSLADKISDVDQSTKTVGSHIADQSKLVDGERKKLLETAQKITHSLQEAGGTFLKQSSVLSKASQEASEQAIKLTEADFNLKREGFFSSAKFIVESLHSLSVDFTRMLEGGEVHEKSWKAFQRGDVGAFTRRLLQMKDDLPTDKIKDKYASDHEFRNYVQRYFRLFEELYDQAATTDHADLLSSTFMSSDIGKLYVFLCQVLEREARGDDKKILH